MSDKMTVSVVLGGLLGIFAPLSVALFYIPYRSNTTFPVGTCVNVIPDPTDDIVNIYLYPPARGIGRVRSAVMGSDNKPIYQIQFAANPEEDTLVLDMGKDSVVVPCKQYEVDVRLYLLQRQIDELEALVRVYGGPNEVSVK